MNRSTPQHPPPTVWVLVDDRPGNTTQSVGLADALGWPYQSKELHFNTRARLLHRFLGAYPATCIGLDKERSAALMPPWPGLVIAAGWRAAPIARWIRKQSRGGTHIVHLGRKGAQVAGLFDAVVTCVHCCLQPHPRRIELTVPLTKVTSERLAQAAAQWRHVFDKLKRPCVALLVGGTTPRYRLDAETAQRMGEEVRAFADAAGGSVFALTSRRTGTAATEALKQGLGEANFLHAWQPDQRDNPYLGCLALADVLVVTGESESMLAEAAACGKPMYIYSLPRQPRPPSGWTRLKGWIMAHAAVPARVPDNDWRQRSMTPLCRGLVASGLVLPWRDLSVLHEALIRASVTGIQW